MRALMVLLGIVLALHLGNYMQVNNISFAMLADDVSEFDFEKLLNRSSTESQIQEFEFSNKVVFNSVPNVFIKRALSEQYGFDGAYRYINEAGFSKCVGEKTTLICDVKLHHEYNLSKSINSTMKINDPKAFNDLVNIIMNGKFAKLH